MFAQVKIQKMGARRFTYRVPVERSVAVGDPVKVEMRGRVHEAEVTALLETCPMPPERIRSLILDPIVNLDAPRAAGPARETLPAGGFRISKRAFFTAVGYTPHEGQEPIHASLEDPAIRDVAAVCGTRFGKTKLAAHEMAFEAIQPRARTPVNPEAEFKGWCVGPTHDKAKIVFDMIVQILRKYMKGHVRVNNTDGVIEFTNLGGSTSIIKRKTTQDAAGKGRLVGEAVDFMVIDEAASIKDPEIWQGQLSTRLMDRKGRSLHISSPRGVDGYFAALYRKAGVDPSVAGFKMPTWVNPYVDKKEISYRRSTMPKRRFDAEIGAELLADSGMVFDRQDLEQLFVCNFEEPMPTGDYFASIDLAITNDYTVLTIARAPLKGEKPACPRIVFQERFYKMPIEAQLSRMHATLDAYGGCTAMVDHNGIGQSIFQQMVNRGMSVRPLYTTGTGKNSKKDLVFNAAALVERHGILMPRRDLVPTFWDEMTIFQWEETPNGSLTANAPAGAHDDTVAGFILLCSWIQAAGTAGEGLVYHGGMAPPPSAAPKTTRPELQARGDALPDDDTDEGQVYVPRSRGGVVDGRSRGGILRSGNLFRPW